MIIFLRIFQTIANTKFRKIWICVSDLLGGIFYPYMSTIQFNSVYLPIKGPQGATGMNKQYAQ